MTLCPGKEIILRKYLADQWDSAQEGAGFGFVSQALGHLQQEYGEPGAGAGLGHWPHTAHLSCCSSARKLNTSVITS